MAKKPKKTEAKSVPTIYVRVDAALKARVVHACAVERRTEKEIVKAALEQYLPVREVML